MNINNEKTGNVNIPGALHSTGGDGDGQVGGVVAYAGDVYDETLEKNQKEINQTLFADSNVIAVALNDLNEKVEEQEKVTSSGLNDLKDKVDNLNEKVDDNEKTTETALTDLDKKTDNNEKAVSAALNDLDDRVTTLENAEITAEDVTYDSSETYTNGTVGYAIKDLQTAVVGVPTYSAGTGISISNNTISVNTSSLNYNDLSNIPLLKTAENGFKVNAHGRRKNTASEQDSFAEGVGTTASGLGSHSEGGGTIASGTCSHAEGNGVSAVGNSSHAEGSFTAAIGSNSHAEGNNAHAYGSNTHAEGLQETLLPLTTRAYTATSNALYINTEILPGCIIYDTDDTPKKVLSCEYQEISDDYKVTFQGINKDLKIGDEIYVDFCAYGENSHTEGYNTHTYGASSHAEGVHTITTNEAEHASGMYNMSTANKTLFSVGAGHDGGRMNAFEIDTNSNVYIYGVGGYDGTNSTTTGIKSLQGVISDIESNSSSSSSSYTHPSTHPASMITYNASIKYESGNVGYEIKQIETDLSTRLGGIKSTGHAEDNSGAAIGGYALTYKGRQRMYDAANREYINVIYTNAGTVSVGENTCAIGEYSFAAGQGNNGGGNSSNYYYHVASTYEAGDEYIYLQEEPVGQYLSFKEDSYDDPSGDHLAKIVSKSYDDHVWKVRLAEPYINRNMNANLWIYPITGAHGQNSSSFGMLTVAQGDGSTVVGKYNYPMSNELFSVGCGTGLPASTRKNALIVLDDGSIYINGIGDFDGKTINYSVTSLLDVIQGLSDTVSNLDTLVLTDQITETGSAVTVASLTPNEYHKWGKLTSLTITALGSGVSGKMNEYMIEFESGSTATTLSLPSGITWMNNDDPTSKILANKKYQISIVNNLGVYAEF